MRNFKRSLVAVAAAAGALLGASEASAGGHGVVFIHGTGNYAGTNTCSGTGTGFHCTVPAAVSGYWGQGEIDSVRAGRAYEVVGFLGGSNTPWVNPSPYKGSGTESGNGDTIAAQIYRFLAGPDGINGNSDDITDIVLVTHSGGSNQARYILQNYTHSTQFTAVKNATKRVVTVAAPTLGTYLAQQVTSGGVTGLLGGLLGFNDDGTYFIRTDTIATNNASTGKFGGILNPVNGVNFYSTGGVSGTTCYGVTVWGACIGVRGPTLGGVIGACDSALDDTGLLALHTAYLNTNDSGTARNSCSDGFISCMSSNRLGNAFSYNQKQDHNQSRRQCNGEDVAIQRYVTASEAGFTNSVWPAEEVPVAKVDACQFSVGSTVLNSNGTTAGYTAGCRQSDLGDGWCDWDCVAMYGHDAPATFDSSNRVTWTAGGVDDCANPTYTTSNTYTSAATCTVAADCAADAYGNSATCVAGKCTFNYTDVSNNPWGDYGTYTTDGSSYHYTQFNGKSNNGSSTVYFTDPMYGTANAVGYCPQSWIGDGTCDECVLALYGSDGSDCLPGHIVQCGGIMTTSAPWGSTNNAIFDEGNASNGGATWFFWQSLSAVANNGRCENTECTQGTGSASTMQSVFPCASGSDCPGMLGCNTGTGLCTLCTGNANNASGSCNSTTYGWSGGTCNTNTGICYQTNTLSAQCASNSDCLTGTCVNGGCTTSSSDCTASFTVVSTTATCATTADCNGAGNCVGGVCGGCSTTADCNGIGTCTGSVCTSSVAGSLCR